MTKKTSKTMIKDNLVKRLINTYTDEIIIEDGELDFENTVYNFAVKIVDEIDPSQQKSMLGYVFDDYEECYSFLENNLPTLRHELEIFTDKDAD
jgi:hypothetical protein